jgi:hypothetical protein
MSTPVKKLIMVEIKQSAGPKCWYRRKIGHMYIARQCLGYYKVLHRGKEDFLARYIAKGDAKKVGEVLVPKALSI